MELSKHTEIRENSLAEKSLDSPKINIERFSVEQCQYLVNNFDSDLYSSLPENKKMMMVRDYHQKFSGSMGVKTNLMFNDMPTRSRGCYIHDSKTVYINTNILDNPRQLLTTDLHELRHAVQHSAIDSPFKYDISNDIINAWKDNFENYYSAEDNFPKYYNQPVEVDARAYAQTIMEKY